MMKPKHTPGPWTVEAEHDFKRSYPLVEKVGENTLFEATLWLYRREDTKLIPDLLSEEAQANARLIAAAPEMYDIIFKAVELFEQDFSADEYITEMLKMEGLAKELIYKIQGK